MAKPDPGSLYYACLQRLRKLESALKELVSEPQTMHDAERETPADRSRRIGRATRRLEAEINKARMECNKLKKAWEVRGGDSGPGSKHESVQSIAQLLAALLAEAWDEDEDDMDASLRAADRGGRAERYPAGHSALKHLPRDPKLAAARIRLIGPDIGRMVGLRGALRSQVTGMQPPLFEVTISGTGEETKGGKARLVIRGHAQQRKFDIHYVMPPGFSKDADFVLMVRRASLSFGNVPPERESYKTTAEYRVAYQRWSDDRQRAILMARINKLMKGAYFRGWKMRHAYWESSLHFNKHYQAPYGTLK